VTSAERFEKWWNSIHIQGLSTTHAAVRATWDEQQKEIDRLEAALVKIGVCHLTQTNDWDDSGMWSTDCGETFWYEDPPNVDTHRFCTVCGKPCEVVPAPEYKDEDEEPEIKEDE